MRLRAAVKTTDLALAGTLVPYDIAMRNRAKTSKMCMTAHVVSHQL